MTASQAYLRFGVSYWLLAGATLVAAVGQPVRSRTTAPAGEVERLWDAARNGRIAAVKELVRAGVNVNAADDRGRTALHHAAENGHLGTVEVLLAAGADANRKDHDGVTPLDLARANGHDGTAAALTAAMKTGSADRGPTQGLNPALKYPDLASFERSIGKPATLLKSEHVWLFAPKVRESEAQIVLPYLVRAYDELRRITGVDTEYVIVVFHFPVGHPDAKGGTSECTIWYDERNLTLNDQEEWKKHHRPHVSGYIEEMAHNFVSATKAQFGWEMIGWSIGAKVCAQVAGNPVHSSQIEDTRRKQRRTFERYQAQGFVFPTDLPANLVDRIHAHLLWQCEQRYRGDFWVDCFREIGKRTKELEGAVRLGDADAVRNERYRITVECFDQLPGLHFKPTLDTAGISTTVDVKSLHPTEPGWSRRLK